MNLLLDNGADINAHSQFPGHNTALQLACRSNHFHLVEILVQHGADVNLTPQDTQPLLGLLIESAGSGNERIYKTVGFLLDSGADINGVGKHGTALHSVITGSAFEFLLSSDGLEINHRGGFFGTAFQAACSQVFCKELVELLLEKEADPSIQGGFYGKALQTACYQSNDLEVVRLKRLSRPR